MIRWALPMVLSLPLALRADPVKPFDVADRAQLFVDRVLVRSAENVEFTFHPARKHPKNPLVKVDRPEDGWRLALCGSMIYDEEEKLFKMWYLGGNGTLYATSKDGITWQKDPDAFWRGYMFSSVIKDKTDRDPARRYKIIAWSPNAPGVLTPGYERPVRSGYNTSISPDGKRIALLSQRPICPKGDVITGYYDRQRRLYVAFPKQMTKVRGFNRRCFAIITSKDFLTWTEPRLVFVPDPQDDAGSLARIEEARPILDVPDNPKLIRTEFYGVGVYQHESCIIAFPWIFTISNTSRVRTQEGPGEIQLAVSRDLERWDRPFRVPCIPRGKAGEWDSGFFWTPAEAVRVGDEIRLYYAASNYGHGNRCVRETEGRLTKFTASIGLATWKLDRFVSVDVPAKGGILTTVPIVFSGSRLELNATTKKDGNIIVEVLDTRGRVIARSKPIVGDDLRYQVVWEHNGAIAKLANTPISLRFLLKSAELYSFAFRH